MAVTDRDEALHEMAEPSPDWRDAVDFVAWDPATSAVVAVRACVAPGRPGAEAEVTVWHDGAVRAALHHRLDHLPWADWDVMAIGPVSLQMQRALAEWVLRIAGRDGTRAYLSFTGSSACTAVADAAIAATAGAGRYAQLCRVQGDLVVEDRRIGIGGGGVRSHGWGIAAPAAVTEGHHLVGGDAAGTIGLSTHTWLMADGRVRTDGVVHLDGTDHRVVGVEQQLVGLPPTQTLLEVVLATGQVVRVQGEAAAAARMTPAAGGGERHDVPMRVAIRIGDRRVLGLGLASIEVAPATG